ncbi:MAG: hypothetical protein JG774_1204 [Desulfomicrobiaceae bacterium]|jgi:hypothetical protein|nr:hypothetical protein [Desulfomicrobiaceae bacterium]
MGGGEYLGLRYGQVTCQNNLGCKEGRGRRNVRGSVCWSGR